MSVIVTILSSFVLCFAAVYLIVLPPINLTSLQFWIILLICLVVSLTLGALSKETAQKKASPEEREKYYDKNGLATRFMSAVRVCIGLSLAAIVIGGISSAVIFHVGTYRNQLSVETVSFEDAIIEDKSISDIAIMDTETAKIIGTRAMGSLTELVSQYEVGEDYSTIAYGTVPMKVACLEYGGIIKYFTNSSTGVPGYIQVDPVKNTAQFVKTKEPIHYVESAVFSEDLYRHIRSKYLTEMIYGMYFEVDDAGNPYWVCPVETHTAGLFGGTEIKEVILVDACSGNMEKYSVADVPSWVDRVYDANLLCKYYNRYGTLASGFVNSVIGNKGCTVTTDDYGYKIIDGDVWIYTGVTSVASDESNLGFLLMNERTKEAKYFLCPGAEEYSAMSAAEGMVQDLGYRAAFPSIINIGGEPTYLCCLKDGSGLVKMYALVNVTQYNLVGVGTTQNDALKSYKQILSANKVDISTGEILSKEIIITDIRYIMVEGDTIVFIFDEKNNCYKMQFSENEELILLNAGDYAKITYEQGDNAIFTLKSFKVVK